MFQQEISQLNLPKLKAGEKRWLGNLQGSSTALLLKEIIKQQQSRLFVIVARNNQHLGQLESELEFYGIKPTIFPDWKFCLMTVCHRIRISSLNVWQFYLICPKVAYCCWQLLHWHSVLHLLHGCWVNTSIFESGKSWIWNSKRKTDSGWLSSGRYRL